MATLESEVTAAFTHILGNRQRGELVASRLGLSGRRPSLAEMGHALGLSRERARQIVEATLDEFVSRRPVLRSLDAIELGIFETSVHARPVAAVVAQHGLASAGNEKWGLIWLANLYGYSRLATELGQHEAVAFEDQFLTELRKIVRQRGAIRLASLLRELDDAGWDVTRDQLLLAATAMKDLNEAQNVLVATSDDGTVANAIKKALAVNSPAHLISLLNSVVRVQQSRGSSRVIDIEELGAFLQHGPPLAEKTSESFYCSREPLNADGVLEGIEREIFDLIEATPDGLISRRQLRDELIALGYSEHSATQYMSYSPVVDFACSGVFRLRGRPFNAGAADRIRRSQSARAGWTQWGWAGVDSIWLITTTNDGRVRLRLPAEIANLLATRGFQGVFADGTVVGKITVSSNLEFELPDFLGTGRLALEIRLFKEPRIILIPLGESNDLDETYPGEVDGCILRNGGWQFVVEVDESTLAGEHVLVPSVLLRRLGLEIGDTADIEGVGGSLSLECLPHAGHIGPLDKELKVLNATVGDRVIAALDRDALKMQCVGSTHQGRGTTEDLLIRVGIPPAEAAGNIWAVMGSALGFSGARDRLSISQLLRRRERPDLAQCAIDSREGRRESATLENWLHSGQLVEDRSQLAFRTSHGDLQLAVGLAEPGAVAPPGTVRGPLGIFWRREHELSCDPNSTNLDEGWVRWARAFIMVLGAAQGGPIELSTDGEVWTAGQSDDTELLNVLETIATSHSAHGQIPVTNDQFFLPSAFAFRRVAREARQAGLRELNFTAEGIVAVSAKGRRSNPCSPREALLFCLD